MGMMCSGVSIFGEHAGGLSAWSAGITETAQTSIKNPKNSIKIYRYLIRKPIFDKICH
jgi:hypothetical protein